MKIIKGVFLGLLTAFTLVFAPATTVKAQETKVAIIDTAFISKNIMENVVEISLAQLGEQKSVDPEIKKAANQIIADQNQVLSDLKKIGRKKNMVEANENNNGSPNITSYPGLQGLENATGREFEKIWLLQMLSRQEAKIAELETTSPQLSDVELKSVANRALQKIKIHRDMLSRMKYKYQQ